MPNQLQQLNGPLHMFNWKICNSNYKINLTSTFQREKERAFLFIQLIEGDGCYPVVSLHSEAWL